VAVLLLLGLALALAGCGPDATPQIRVMTATFTPSPAVRVVTATSTPVARALATETLEPGAAVALPAEPTVTLAPTRSDTGSEPTATLAPTGVEASATPEPQDTATPEVSATAPPRPTQPAASLNLYGVIYSNFDGGPETDEHKYSVWVMRGDGKQATEILRPAIEPAYAPNGQKVAYYRPFNGIWIYDVAKESASHIVVNDYAEFASFSPDGTKLVFHEWVGNWASANVNLYTINVDGSGRTQLPQGIRPAWSPKGGLIAFDSCRGTSCGIFVVQPNGQGLRQVTSDGGGKVSWSPNGKKLVYSSEADGDPEIWSVNLDGSGARQLTNNSGNDTLPVYSPDGQYIYFLSDQNGQAWAIRAMRPNGSGVQTIRRVGVPPRWQFSRLWVGWW
jgi:hypothetical protein